MQHFLPRTWKRQSALLFTGCARSAHVAFVSLLYCERPRMRAAVWGKRTGESAWKLGVLTATQISRKAGGLARSGSGAVAGMPGQDQPGRNRFMGGPSKR